MGVNTVSNKMLKLTINFIVNSFIYNPYINLFQAIVNVSS